MVHLSMGVSDMKKFLIRIAIFFAIVTVVDFSLGKVFHYLQAHAGGRTGAEYYVCEKATEDIIIMGSSRASHHYVPEIISEKLGMSCFNAGQDGNGIILQYGRWKMLSERYNPKMIIYDVTPGFDLSLNDNMTYIDRLKPFSYCTAVNDFVSDLFPLERFKMLSKMYCFNYKFIEMISDCARKKENDNKGYLPLYGLIRQEIVDSSSKDEKNNTIEIDEVKLHYLRELANDCKERGIKLVFVTSPSFMGRGLNSESFSSIQRIADEFEVPYYFYYKSDFSNTPQLFKDSSHLNDEGAKQFTEEIVSRIQS